MRNFLPLCIVSASYAISSTFVFPFLGAPEAPRSIGNLFKTGYPFAQTRVRRGSGNVAYGYSWPQRCTEAGAYGPARSWPRVLPVEGRGMGEGAPPGSEMIRGGEDKETHGHPLVPAYRVSLTNRNFSNN